MQEHSRYEEMCAAAAAGQISAEELSELQAHIELCNCCKDLQREFIEISSLCLTHGQKLEPEIYNPESALRKKVLQKLQTAGAEFSAPVRKEIAERPARLGSSWIGAFRSPTPVWAVALVVFGTT